jgi:hypothetical protein
MAIEIKSKIEDVRWPSGVRLPIMLTAGVQSVLNFTRHAGAKTAKSEQFIDNSILTELEKSGFVSQVFGR